MFLWVADKVSSQWLYGGPYNPSYDPATQALVKLDRNPNPLTERYDPNAKDPIRPATAQEQADFQAAKLDAEALARFDGEKMLKAGLIWTAQKLGISLAQARQEILAIYRAL